MNKRESTADVIIVGGGVIGLSIARSLSLKGVHDVLLLERGSLGTEASFAAGGMLAPQSEANRRDQFFDLLCESRDLYPVFASALRNETGIDIELDTTGTIYLAFNEHDQTEINERYEWQTRAGLPVEKLTADEAQMLEPGIAPKATGALRFPLDIQVENRRLLSALANSISELGVRIICGVNVDSVCTDKSRVRGVQTSNGQFHCSTVVLAAGSWTSSIVQTVRVEPVRGQMICFTSQKQLARHVLYSPRGYVVPRQNGRLLAGSTSESAGFVKEVTAAGVRHILRNALEIAPQMAALSITDFWSGLRPKAPDGLPVLGPCGEIDGLIYATGHYRNGILLAPITGELIASAITESNVPETLAPFSPDRFVGVTTK